MAVSLPQISCLSNSSNKQMLIAQVKTECVCLVLSHEFIIIDFWIFFLFHQIFWCISWNLFIWSAGKHLNRKGQKTEQWVRAGIKPELLIIRKGQGKSLEPLNIFSLCHIVIFWMIITSLLREWASILSACAKMSVRMKRGVESNKTVCRRWINYFI